MIKKGQIGDTLTWIVATIIIAFVLFFFLIYMSFYSVNEKVDLTKTKTVSNVNLIATKNLVTFLGKEVSGEKIYDIVAKADANDKKNLEIFKSESEKFIKDNLEIGGEYYRSWIRVYNSREEVGQYYISKIEGYEFSSFSRGDKGGVDCDPDEKNSLVAIVFVTGDKKIVLCANREND